jgi:hypothetical protein
MSLSRAYCSACKYPGGDYIFIIGGITTMNTSPFETERIERYDILNNKFEIFPISMLQPVYGCISLFIGSKLLIAGGRHSTKGNTDQVYTIDFNAAGKIDILQPLPTACWTVLPVTNYNGDLHIFATGQETQGFPEHISYRLNTY